MPIIFSFNPGDSYFVSQYKGAITNKSALDDYKSFYASGEWIPGTNELVDLSEADLSSLTSKEIDALADNMNIFYIENNVTSVKVAIYAPETLKYGLSRMYEAFSYGSPEEIKIFKNRQKAIQWLSIDR